MPLPATITFDISSYKNCPCLSTCKLDSKGVYRWESNNAVVPSDTMAKHAPAAYDMAKHKAQERADTAALLNAYRADPPKRSAEQLAEIRREIGPDAVDIITGKRIFAKVG